MNRKPARRSRRGFTLIELMVVVGIIALLIAIALPAFSAARRASKATASNATINVIGLGLEQFRTDAQLGGQYPPSVQLNEFFNGTFEGPHGTGKVEGTLSGASLLAWALAGADLLGTPGFRNADGDSTGDPFGGWLSDVNARFVSANPSLSGLYALDNAGKPVHPRYGPYVELSKMKTPARAGQKMFELPVGPKDKMLGSVCFLDSFDQPILYYKANVGAPAMAASGRVTPEGGSGENNYVGEPDRYVPNGVYNMLDNSGITGNGSALGMDLGAGTGHFTPTGQNHPTLGTVTVVQYRNGTKPDPRSFQHTVWNSNVTATLRPQREDSYILLSAGPDGLFGTGDDIANFPMNQ